MFPGSSSAWLSVRRSARGGCGGWAVGLLLLLSAARLPAADDTPRSVTVSWSQLNDWTQDLSRADLLLTELQSRLRTSADDYEKLKLLLDKANETLQQLETSVTLWQQHSTTLARSLEDSEQLSLTLQTSLASLKTRSENLSMEWSSYRSASETALKRLNAEAGTWRAAAVGGILGALVVGVVVGLLAGR